MRVYLKCGIPPHNIFSNLKIFRNGTFFQKPKVDSDIEFYPLHDQIRYVNLNNCEF